MCSYTAGAAVALQALQVGAKFGGRLAAQLPVFLKRFVQKVFKLCGEFRIERNRWRRRVVQNAIEDHCRRGPAEWALPGRHFVENASERKEVAAQVQRIAARQFR